MSQGNKNETAKKKVTEKPNPNLALVARDKDGNILIEKALEEIQTTSGVINLPKREDQAKPFYCQDAEKVVSAMPHLYKLIKSKG